jgi:hypothetical protein
MSWDDLTARLQDEYERRESSMNEGGAALISSQRKNRGLKCFACGKYGHIKTNCNEKSSRGSEESDSDDGAKMKRSKKSYSTKAAEKKQPDRKCDESRNGMRLLTAKDAKEQEDDQFLNDSGASSHMAKPRNIMTNVKKIPERKTVTANNEVLVCNRSGDVDVRVYDPEGDMITTARLRKVLYVPGLHANLLSCAALTKSRVEVTFTSDGCHLVDQDDGQLIGYGAKGADDLCALMADVVHQARASIAAESSVNLWHARLGHVSKATIRDVVLEKKAKRITLSESEDVIDRDECCNGKQTRKMFSGRISMAKQVGGVIHSDVCGPMLPSLGGHQYFVWFIDEKSRSGTLALLSKKGDVKDGFKAFKTRFEKKNDTVIKRLHSDRGGDCSSRTLLLDIRPLTVRELAISTANCPSCGEQNCNNLRTKTLMSTDCR